jgi:hypothetical protein
MNNSHMMIQDYHYGNCFAMKFYLVRETTLLTLLSE